MTLAPGDTLKTIVTLRPFKGAKQRVTLEVKLPADFPKAVTRRCSATT